MRELSVQSSNDTNTTTDRTAIQSEVNQLTSEINRIANTTEFNTKKLLNGDLVGVQGAQGGTLTTAGTFGNGNVAISTATNFSTAVNTDVIRVNVVNVSGSAYVTNGNLSNMTLSITTVLGNIVTNGILISGNNIVISGGGSDGAASYDLTLQIQNAVAINSGDTITLNVQKQQAAQTDSSKQIRAQIGANDGQELGIGINRMDSVGLGIQTTGGAALDVTSQSKASGAISLINSAIEKVSSERSKLGAFQNRLEHTINNLNTSSENLQASESRVRDVDMAKEMTNYSKNNILTQAAQAMLAQAKSAPEAVLQLLR